MMRDLTEMSIMMIQKRNRMPFTCQAGTRLVEMNEYGELFPCETLDTLIKEGDVLQTPSFKDSWMGNVRDHEYDFRRVLRTRKARSVNKFIQNDGCACTFECAIGASLVFRPTNIFHMQFIKIKSMLRRK
jgi:hypothetical protein